MEPSKEQVKQYEEQGFVILENIFDNSELNQITLAIEHCIKTQPEGIIKEPDRDVIRSIFGCHLYNDYFANLIRDQRLSGAAKTLLNDAVYIHQLKVNYKYAMDGGHWPWHQDFIFWNNHDGIERSQMVNVALIMDDITEFNGPLMMIAGSHIDEFMKTKSNACADRDWHNMVSENLRYQLDAEIVKKYVKQGYPMVSPRPKAGDIMLFHPCVAHGSPCNMSIHDRRMIIFTYNAVGNQPDPKHMTRPSFLSATNFDPL